MGRRKETPYYACLHGHEYTEKTVYINPKYPTIRICRICQRDSQRRYAKDKFSLSHWRRYHFQHRYGITLERYYEMVEKQGGVCALCHRTSQTINPKTGEPRPLYVDHNHENGKVRGLLCQKCNTALAQFGDSVEVLERAIKYIKASE